MSAVAHSDTATPRAAAHSPADMPSSWGEALRLFARHPSPRILAALLAAAATARAAVGGFTPAELLLPVGYALFWPLQEWAIHVFVLHWRPLRVLGLTLDFRVPRKHRAHHRDPWDAALIFIPLHSYVYTVPLLVGLWIGLAPTLGFALSGLVLHLALTLHYEWVHFFVHTRVVPKSWLYKRLWRNHRLHHFKNERYWYGVTMLSGDRLLATQPDRDAVPTSPTARDLHGEALA